MSAVYLNGQFMASEQASISPMDRGFLFGDGLYEVIPSHAGQLVGFGLHLARLRNGLAEIALDIPWSDAELRRIIDQLVEQNGAGDLGVYLHVTRGVAEKRFHGFPDNPNPTLFAYTFDIPARFAPQLDHANALSVVTSEDKRWKRCHIKSTSLLGNVLHFQTGQEKGVDECILFNENNELTEAAACNVFIVDDNTIATPPLGNGLLAGVTRQLVIDIMSSHGHRKVMERVISKQEVLAAKEVWLSSSSKDIAPVVSIDNQPVGEGKPGPVWLEAARLFYRHKFDF